MSLSARQSVSQDNIVAASGGVIFRATYTGLPLLSFLLFSTYQSRASVVAAVLIPRCQLLPETGPHSARLGFSFGPSSRLHLAGTYALSFLGKRRALVRFPLRRFQAGS